MTAETRVVRGPAGRRLGAHVVGDGQWAVGDDAFLLRADGEIGVHYRREVGVTLEAPEDADPREIELWLNGTLYAAIAALNGLFPLHASAVAHAGRVFAFTGPSGAGKSTVVAALGRRGFAQVCDDTLILDVSGKGAPLCLPGHKRLKLWREGAALAGVAAEEQVARSYPKYFVAPAAGAVSEPLPLAELIVLAPGVKASFTALSGGSRIAALEAEHYTTQLWRLVQRPRREEHFAELATLTQRFAVTRFERSLDPGEFERNLDAVAAHIGYGR